MRVLYAFLLQIFHFIYAAVLLIRSFWKRNSAPAPQPLRASRPRIPKHLAIVFNVDPTVSEQVAQEILTESVVDAVSWCRTVGIGKLTVYEEKDILSRSIHAIRERLPIHGQETEMSDSETDYPLTPPASEYSESRPLSPDIAQAHSTPISTILVTDPAPRKEIKKRLGLQRRRQQPIDEAPQGDLLLCFVSRKGSKPAIANAAEDLAHIYAQQFHRKTTRASKVESETYKLSVDELNQILEEEDGLSSPDFMIIHPVESSSAILAPPELHGFPPWHIRLTEIYQNKPPKSSLQRVFRGQWAHLPAALDETSFRSALDEFTSAEMRFGK